MGIVEYIIIALAIFSIMVLISAQLKAASRAYLKKIPKQVIPPFEIEERPQEEEIFDLVELSDRYASIDEPDVKDIEEEYKPEEAHIQERHNLLNKQIRVIDFDENRHDRKTPFSILSSQDTDLEEFAIRIPPPDSNKQAKKILEIIKNPEQLRNAVIISEILKRKGEDFDNERSQNRK